MNIHQWRSWHPCGHSLAKTLVWILTVGSWSCKSLHRNVLDLMLVLMYCRVDMWVGRLSWRNTTHIRGFTLPHYFMSELYIWSEYRRSSLELRPASLVLIRVTLPECCLNDDACFVRALYSRLEIRKLSIWDSIAVMTTTGCISTCAWCVESFNIPLGCTEFHPKWMGGV